ncbi:hypothetical protein QUB05_27945 [Microcoleus sp. F10-C6]
MNKGAGCEMKFLLQEFAWQVLIPLRGKVNCDIETSERQQYHIL